MDAAELQRFVYERLAADAPLAALVGDAIYDRPPQNAPYPRVTFGPDDAIPDDADCAPGSIHSLQIDVWDRSQGGRKDAKKITAAIYAALHEISGDLGGDFLVELRVERVRHIDDPDEITTHGIVSLQALLDHG